MASDGATRMKTELALYELAGPLQEALSRLTDLGMDETTIADTIDGMAVEFREKAIAVVSVARNLESLAASIKSAEEEMARRRKTLERRAATVRQYVKEQMERTGVTRVDCPYFQLAIRQNPPSVVVDAAAMIPDEFWRAPPPPERMVDKAAIAAAIKAGQEVPGAHLAQSTRLDVK